MLDASAPPSLSVVVPTLAGAARLPALLDSLEVQDVEATWELIVVMDGVVDDTPAVLDERRHRLPLRTLRLESPQGVASALAAGFAAARGEIVMRCDDDLTLPAGLLRAHLALHREHPHLGVISLTRDVFPDTPYARAYGRPANDRARRAALAREPGERWQHWAACNSVRRADYEACGGFDPRFSYREDSELGLRLAQHGVEMVIPSELTVEHRGPATSAETRLGRAFLSGASLIPFGERHPDVAVHSSPAGTARAHLWNVVTLLLSLAIRSSAGARRAGRLLDRVLPWIPTVVSGRVVALGVESAGRAGRDHGAGSTWQKLEEQR